MYMNEGSRKQKPCFLLFIIKVCVCVREISKKITWPKKN